MVTEQIPPVPYRPVTVYIPNEVEGQILGGTQTHSNTSIEICRPLETYALRQGRDWLVRQETQILYPRTSYSRPQDRIGSLYPDCLVAVGVQVDEMEPYHLEHIGIPPILLMEVISKRTRRKDITTKIQAYADMGVQEYVTFDPRPRKKLELRGYRLFGVGHYVPIPAAPEGGLWLASVGLRAVGELAKEKGRGNRLRFYTEAGEPLLFTHEEGALRLQEQQARQEAEWGRERERQARLKAEQAEDGERQARLRLEEQRDIERARAERLAALLAEHGISADLI